jgi:hypothetical protein
MVNRVNSCDGNHIRLPGSASRREFLYVGLLGGLGLTLPDFLRMEAQANPVVPGFQTYPAKAQSVIHIFLPGGIAHQESWDPKPLAPSDYRGPLGTVETSLPGVYFSELFKETAKVADRATIIRSMTHGEAAHERGTHNMFTGYRPSPAIQYPSFGSIISHEYGPRKNLPPYVCVPNVPNEFAGSGYLSSSYGPFGIGADPAQEKFSVRDLALPNGITEARFERRRNLLGAVDAHFKNMEKSADSVVAMDTFYQRAYDLIGSKEAREAFNLASETDKIKDEYGRNDAGMRFLLSRRLVEAGVRFVSTTYGGWDHHNNVKQGMEAGVPKLDQALARLIRDLEDRGMLDTTLVMVTSEFGRTPKINGTGGRDHWPRVFSTFLAGGGFKRGIVHGASDALGGEPADNPVGPESLAATMYYLLGIDPTKRIVAPGDRPIDIVRDGEILSDLLV